MSGIQPIIVIGAARSGTKVLRDSLAMASGAGVVPYDIGYVWRYGNETSPHDMLEPEDVKPETRRFARRFLARYANRDGLLVEKTVGNTLRVGYVSEVVPEARVVYLERDGVDVAISTQKEWLTPTNWRYLARKSRHFPVRLAPSYGAKFLRAQTLDRWRGEGHVGTWGPRYPGIDHDLSVDGLLPVCARQWRQSVSSATSQLAVIPQPVATVSYTKLVTSPEEALSGLLQELGLPVDRTRVGQAAGMLNSGASRPARPCLSEPDRVVLTEELGTILKERGYDQP